MQPGALGMDGVPQIGAVFQSEDLDLKKSGREVPDKKRNHDWQLYQLSFSHEMLSFLDPHKGGINIGELGMLGDFFGIGTQRLHVAQGGWMGFPRMILWLPTQEGSCAEWMRKGL